VPQGLPFEFDRRLVSPHPARFTTSKQHCSERSHLPLVILSEVLQKQNEVEESLIFFPREASPEANSQRCFDSAQHDNGVMVGFASPRCSFVR
jgi:hypothetical protein